MKLEDAQKNQAIGEKLYLSVFFVKHKAFFHADFVPTGCILEAMRKVRFLLGHRVSHGTSHNPDTH
jgi:hypothetical protein